MNTQPLVSILCATYNQKNFIAQTIEGFLMQKVNFPIEIIIHDDASTDGTTEIIAQYAQKYPNLIKAILQKENQYSKIKDIWSKFIYPSAKGKYFAECEGDDYWTDPNKLQRQVDFLESHPDYILSTENANVLFTETNIIKPFSTEPEHDVSLDDLLIRRRFPTASVVYRNTYIKELSQQEASSFDTMMWAFLAQKGKVHFNPIISSVYRRGSGVTESNKIKWAYTNERYNKEITEFFKPNKSVIKERNKALYQDFRNGIKAAKKQGKRNDYLKLSAKAFCLSPLSYIADIFKRRWKKYITGEEKRIQRANFWVKFQPTKKLAPSHRETPIVVSLTSYPARFSTLHLCLKSIFNQTLQADKIVLYLDKTVSLQDVPKKILDMRDKGLEIRTICENIKPHNKYFYAMQEFSNAIIITVDDDALYSKDCIESLYRNFKKYPNCISARRVHKTTHLLDGTIAPYRLWDLEYKKIATPSSDLMATGVGGVLYPPHIFNTNSDYFKIENIQNHCLNADDVWLMFIENREGIKVCWAPNKHPSPYPIISDKINDFALSNDNVENNRNDYFIEKCQSFFKINI